MSNLDRMTQVVDELNENLTFYVKAVRTGAPIIQSAPSQHLHDIGVRAVVDTVKDKLDALDRLSAELRELVNTEMTLVHMTPDKIASCR